MLFKECSSDPWPVSNHAGLPYSHKESHSHTVEALHFLYTKKKKKLQTCSHFKASKYWKSMKKNAVVLIYSHWRDKNLKRSDESFPPLATILPWFILLLHAITIIKHSITLDNRLMLWVGLNFSSHKKNVQQF
jgi:hypothetical protein